MSFRELTAFYATSTRFRNWSSVLVVPKVVPPFVFSFPNCQRTSHLIVVTCTRDVQSGTWALRPSGKSQGVDCKRSHFQIEFSKS